MSYDSPPLQSSQSADSSSASDSGSSSNETAAPAQPLEVRDIPITVFTSPTCPYCQTLKEYLTLKQFKFEEVDASTDAGREKLLAQTNQITVPALNVAGFVVIGFDLRALNHMLGI